MIKQTLRLATFVAVLLCAACNADKIPQENNKTMEELVLTQEWDKTFPKSNKV